MLCCPVFCPATASTRGSMARSRCLFPGTSFMRSHSRRRASSYTTRIPLRHSGQSRRSRRTNTWRITRPLARRDDPSRFSTRRRAGTGGRSAGGMSTRLPASLLATESSSRFRSARLSVSGVRMPPRAASAPCQFRAVVSTRGLDSASCRAAAPPCCSVHRRTRCAWPRSRGRTGCRCATAR
jgi:hypothetical protein